MQNIIHIIQHALGFCGEGHIDIFDFFTNGYFCFQCYVQTTIVNIKNFLFYLKSDL